MIYTVEFTSTALLDVDLLQQSDPSAYSKFLSLLKELQVHPTWGTGHPEQLKGDFAGHWSRRLSKKHRLIYRVYESEVVVLVISARGHYNDK